MAERRDPIRERYYKPLEQAELAGDIIFYLSTALSLVVLLGALKTLPAWFAGTQIAFLLCTIGGFAIGLGVRLYWAPRAERKRREDFLGNSFGVALTHEATEGYYNNEETEPSRRLGMNVLENTLNTKRTVLEMCKRARMYVVVYLLLWVGLLSVHTIELDWPIVAAQALFSEQLVSRFFRLEWFRIEVERIAEGLSQLFRADPEEHAFRALSTQCAMDYECAKARGGVTLSEKIFFRHREAIAAEWEKLKSTFPKRRG